MHSEQLYLIKGVNTRWSPLDQKYYKWNIRQLSSNGQVILYCDIFAKVDQYAITFAIE